MTTPTEPEVYGEAGTALDYRPADTTLADTGFDTAAQSECQLGNGRNVPTGTTNFGFTDTTYVPTQAQILAQTKTGQI